METSQRAICARASGMISAVGLATRPRSARSCSIQARGCRRGETRLVVRPDACVARLRTKGLGSSVPDQVGAPGCRYVPRLRHKQQLQGRGRRGLGVPLSGAEGTELVTLGRDFLVFLGATVAIVPICNRFKISSILGFLLAGTVLEQIGAFGNAADLTELSELGVLFLLFEMGLELNIDRLTALAKYAFVLGTLQILLCTTVFGGFELPVGNALGSNILEDFLGGSPGLVEIRSVDEALVIGAALSLSSSAFVLQLLAEKGDLPTRYGSATLGILLMQDIAVVPLLVLLPLIETQADTGSAMDLLLALAPTLGKAFAGLSLLLLGGRVVLRKAFELVAASQSNEAFVALCLLTVTGTSVITIQLGLSSTLGAFMAGVLLAETNFRGQVEADIRPFKGLLLGLFFVTTGTSIDIQLLLAEWPNILALTAGLIAIKSSIIIALGPLVGLTRPESVRTGFILSQGGEFAFVVFTLANQLNVLPEELNRLLIVVVILSMVLTPALASAGDKLGNALEEWEAGKAMAAGEEAGGALVQVPVDDGGEGLEPVVLLGFNQTGQVLANMLGSPSLAREGRRRSFVAFDLEPKRVQAARAMGLPVFYGDGANKAVLHAAGVGHPPIVCVCYTDRVRSLEAVARLRTSYGPSLVIHARARDLQHAIALEKAGANSAIPDASVTSLRLGARVMLDLGMEETSVQAATDMLEDSMMTRARNIDTTCTTSMLTMLNEIDSSVASATEREAETVSVQVVPVKADATSNGESKEVKPLPEYTWQQDKADDMPMCADWDMYEECVVDYWFKEEGNYGNDQGEVVSDSIRDSK